MRDRLAHRFLDVLLRLYPRSVRAEYGEEIVGAILARRRALGPRLSCFAAARFWWRESLGLIRGASVARADVRRVVDRPRRMPGITRTLEELRAAIRGLIRRPALLITSVIVLALGVGANAALTGIGWGLLWGRMPFPEAERLVRIFHNDDLTFGVSLNEVLEYRRAETLHDVAGWRIIEATYQGSESPARLSGVRVTPNFFDVMRISLHLGRTFSPNGDRPEVVVSHRFWREHLAGDSTVISGLARFDDEAFEIVGVLPPHVKFPDPAVDFYRPVDMTAPRALGRGGTFMDVIARLQPDAALSHTQAEVETIATRLRMADPAAYASTPDFRAYVLGFRASMLEGHIPLLIAMLVGAGLVLVTTAFSVATLQLANVERRYAEIGIRRAVGGSTFAIVRAFAAESILIAGAGGLVGGFLAVMVGSAFGSLVPVDMVLGDATVTLHVWFAVAAATIVVAALLVLAPVPFVVRTVHIVGGTTPQFWIGRVGFVMRVLQGSVAVVLVTAAMLLLQSARTITGADLGFEVDDVLTARVVLPSSRYANDFAAHDFFSLVLDRLRGAPGIRAAGVVSSLPLSGPGSSGDVYIESVSPDSAVDVIAHRLISPGYFEAMGIPLLAGRAISAADRDGTPRVALVDEVFARRSFGSADAAVGKRIKSYFGGPDWNEIVGVVGSVTHGGPVEEAASHAYYPEAQRPTLSAHVVVAVEGSVDRALDVVRQSLTIADPTLPLFDVATMDQRLRAITERNRFTLRLFGGFAGLAVVLAIVGVFGTVRLALERRVGEVGIRRALGAPHRDILWVLTRSALVTTVLGAVCALPGAVGIGKALQPLLVGVAGATPLLLSGAMTLTLASCFIGALVPAMTHLRTSPVNALRIK